MKKKKQLRVKEAASKADEYKVKPKAAIVRPKVKRAFKTVYERNKKAWEELAKR